MAERILITDDESGVRTALAGILRDEGFAVVTAGDGDACLAALEKERFDLLLLDVLMPKLDGLATLTRVRAVDPDVPVVIISGHGTIETAIKAVRLGAQDFVEKPLSLEKTLLVVRNALRQRQLEAENRALRAQVDQRWTMVGESPAIARLRAEIAQAAPSNGRVLIVGENGTGKELVARNIHQQSLRADRAFVAVNCAAIPEELIESELFGHVRGAFTGALQARKGKFELAHEGTLFLDEIGDMSLKTQAKVLRALQEQRIEPLGGTAAVDVDVRIIAATNKRLAEEIQGGTFREDLYFRLSVIPLEVPPLRERLPDIPLLAAHFVETLAAEHGRRAKVLAPEVLTALAGYPWPGNIRELRNVIERLIIMTRGERIELAHLPPALLAGEPAAGRPVAEAEPADAPLAEARERFERRYITEVLERCAGNMSRAAEVLGLERSNLYRKLKALGMRPR